MGNDLISRSALIEWFSPYMHEDEAISPDVVIGDIKAAPAVDAVEVVRCKDCKFGTYFSNWRYERKFRCELLHFECSPDGFCSYGERSADGT